MLKFLQNREEDRSPKRSPIKYQPQMCYGNSFQSPQEFQTPNTIFHNKTYLNPFLKFENARYNKIPRQSAESLHPAWTHKRNISMAEEHKILKDQKEGNYDLNKSKYLDSFHIQLDNNPNCFRITRGEFTNFIEKNNHYKSIGPLQGIQRTMDRIDDRRRTVWNKSPSKKQEMTSSLRYASSCNTTVKSSISKNSELIGQKFRIRRNRERVQKLFKRQLQERKKQNKTYQFSFSKEKSRQFYLPEIAIETEGMEDLQKFENRLNKKFK